MIQRPIDPNFDLQVQQLPPLRDDTRLAAGKIAFFQYSTVVVFLVLTAGFWRLQIQNPHFYDERALANSIKSVPIPAARGRILDRDGRVIVDNHSSFTLLLARESLNEEHLRPIAKGLDLDYGDLAAKVRHFRSRPKYEPLVLKRELSPADLAFVDAHRDFFPELVLIQAQRRVYPLDGMLAHVIGYTGEISEQELDLPEFGRYEPGAVIGKFGIERQYNDTLTGVDGRRQAVVDNRGQVRRVLQTTPAAPGKDLDLTIDLDLQAVAELAMEGKNGAVVALDPRTGEVLAMVSRPAFDPNRFAGRIQPKDWKEVLANPDHPMLNRAIQAQQAPGSTFKPIMALAALETGTIDDQYSVHCAGGATFYGDYHRCHLKSGHGTVDLHKAIVRSCDVFFYNVGNKMGIDTIARYASMAGYGRPTGVDLPNEAAGVVPSTEWKLHTQRQKWYPGETISVSIGQGALTVTPLQLARAIGGLAMGGTWHRPHMVKTAGQGQKPDVTQLTPEAVEKVVYGMYGVVNEGGTGYLAQIPGLDICGKTGTAQVASAELAKRVGGRDMRDNAWFVGFAPRGAPEIVVAALFDHGVEGPLAAPIVRDVLKVYFDKKSRMSTLRKERVSLARTLAQVSRLGLVRPALL